MPDSLSLFLQIALEIFTLFALLVGLFGLVVPVFPGLTIMWFATLVYALIQSAAGNMSGWDWLLFVIITLLMIGGNIVDNIIIAAKMRDQYIPWSSILISFAAGILLSIFLTPLAGLVAAPLGLFITERIRLKNHSDAIKSTKAYMIGWGWSLGARLLIGIAMIGSWMLWAWI